jgi:hypothetical protein
MEAKKAPGRKVREGAAVRMRAPHLLRGTVETEQPSTGADSRRGDRAGHRACRAPVLP